MRSLQQKASWGARSVYAQCSRPSARSAVSTSAWGTRQQLAGQQVCARLCGSCGRLCLCWRSASASTQHALHRQPTSWMRSMPHACYGSNAREPTHRPSKRGGSLAAPTSVALTTPPPFVNPPPQAAVPLPSQQPAQQPQIGLNVDLHQICVHRRSSFQWQRPCRRRSGRRSGCAAEGGDGGGRRRQGRAGAFLSASGGVCSLRCEASKYHSVRDCIESIMLACM